jgi:fructose-bisphosphate aldolase class II
MTDMLGHAHRNGYAVGAFDLVSLDFLQAILAGAERQDAPVILSLAESHYAYFDPELLMPAVRLAAERARVPVAIHLDHGSSLEAAIRGIRQGFNGVMVDASTQPLGENITRTRSVVEMAHACGVPVEGELGYVAGVEGEDAERHPGEVVYTAPEEAARYVRETGVNFLAVSIGTVHGRMRGEPRLDFDRLAAINAELSIPLVIHGGTGLGDDQFRRLIANGVAKINYYTALADAAGAAIRANAVDPDRRGYTDLAKGIQAAIQAEVERCIALWGGAGRADAVLQACRPWREVEHLVIYNASTDAARTGAMMVEGRRVLSGIPGVRRVHTGMSLREGAAYRHCWLVRFANAAVIDSYRDHPDHRAFADNHFRPLAADRLTIDYQLDP